MRRAAGAALIPPRKRFSRGGGQGRAEIRNDNSAVETFCGMRIARKRIHSAYVSAGNDARALASWSRGLIRGRTDPADGTFTGLPSRQSSKCDYVSWWPRAGGRRPGAAG